jgi:hypothetical protein
MGLWSGQGPVFWSNRDANGDPIAPFTWFGNAPTFEFGMGVEELTHKESYSGLRAIDARIDTELNSTVNLTVDDFRETNLELATRGEASALAGNTVTAEQVLAGAPALNTLYAVAGATGRVTSFALTDNGSPIATTKYSWDASGVFQFSDVAGMTGPIAATYTNAAARQIGVFKRAAPEIWVRMIGKNTAVNSGTDFERLIVDAFKVRLSPAETISLISDEFNTLAFTGSALADPARAQSDPEGQFARFIYLDPGAAVPSASSSPSLSPSASTSPSASSSASPSA